MKPRRETYETYWKFAALRQEIFFNRLTGQEPPWSDDPILNTYKFCNTYRASDRVSQYLIRHVIYSGDQSPSEVVFRILLFKLFNKIETWEYLMTQLNEVTLKNFNTDHYDQLLSTLQRSSPIYNNAYISCATKAFGFDKKHQNHLALIHQMLVKDEITKKIISAKTFESVFKLLRAYPLIGDFMAYQLATDINYSEVIDFDENDFTVVGPGSQRGLKKCFVDLGGKTPGYIIRWMQEHQEQEFRRLGIEFHSLWGRPLMLIDCQGLFCETDKYCRVAFPELASNRVRIKATFSSKYSPIEYFYPPKWNINEKIKKLIKSI